MMVSTHQISVGNRCKADMPVGRDGMNGFVLPQEETVHPMLPPAPWGRQGLFSWPSFVLGSGEYVARTLQLLRWERGKSTGCELNYRAN